VERNSSHVEISIDVEADSADGRGPPSAKLRDVVTDTDDPGLTDLCAGSVAASALPTLS
jgi:hypothetical protein